MSENNFDAAISFIKAIDAIKGESWCEDNKELANAFIGYANFIKKSTWHPMSEIPKKDVHILVYTPTEIERDKFRLVPSDDIKKCSDAILWSYLEEPNNG